MKFDKIYFEPQSLDFALGRQLKDKYSGLPWLPIENHNNIQEMRETGNSEFAKMKRNLIIGIRKTHKYVENQKAVSYTHLKDTVRVAVAVNVQQLLFHHRRGLVHRLFCRRADDIAADKGVP